MGNMSPFFVYFPIFCSCVIHSVHHTLKGHDVNKNITAGSQLREDMFTWEDVDDLEYRRIHDICRKQYGRG
jgi:hypothetical protein